jgi:hypothetical protein
MQNDREIRAREGGEYSEYLRNNGRSSVVDEQPKLNPQMVAPGLFQLQRYPPAEPTQDESTAMDPIDDVTEQLQNNPAMDSIGNVTAQSPNNPAMDPIDNVIENSQNDPAMTHQQSESGQSRAKMTDQPQNNMAKVSELVTVRKTRQARDATPIVVVTGPEDSSQPAHSISAKRPPCPVHELRDQSKILTRQANCPEISNNPSSDQLSREHALVECLTLETADEVQRQLGQETPLSVGSKPIEEIEERRLDSHDLLECATLQTTDAVDGQVGQPTPATIGVVQQHALAECHNSPSATPEVQELSYVHDFTDCPGTVLDYCRKGAKKAQPHDFAYCTGQNSNNTTSGNGIQEHILEDCTRDV